MSITKLDITLEEYEVGISGAIPNRADWSESAMDRGILEFVSLFSGIVFKYGGRIVHGSHPTFVPVILRQARLQAGNRARKPVTLVMSELWAQDLTSEDIASITDIAEFIVTKRIGDNGAGDANTRNRSLSAMRRVLIDAQNMIVAVGGLLHSGDGIVPGVAEEIALAERKGIPRFLVGGLGGYTRELSRKLTPSKLNNALSERANLTLFSTDDVASCVNVLFEHLAGSKELAKIACQPIKWNPSLKAIVDHRDGTVDAEATGHILHALAV